MSIDRNSYLLASSSGVARYVLLSTVVHPLEVIKNNMLDDPSKKMKVVFLRLSQGGIKGFYPGYTPKLIKGSMEQSWTWVVIVEVPFELQKQKVVQIGSLAQQLFAGLTVAFINAGVTTPLDEAITRRSTGDKVKYWTWNYLRQGWKSFPTNFFKGAVGYSSFLISQQWAREKYKQITQKKTLSVFELAQVATFVAGVTSVTTKIPDFFNVHRQLGKTSQQFSMKRVSQEGFRALKPLFRANGPYFSIFWIHNIGSVFLVDFLQNRKAKG